mmetsp:Transcript_31858/g.66968  ORF Transcript_31858/g.66968 Transcript_31858/m.66968 type:complete len:83 (-) Transcript_31858:9-257(-)
MQAALGFQILILKHTIQVVSVQDLAVQPAYDTVLEEEESSGRGEDEMSVKCPRLQWEMGRKKECECKEVCERHDVLLNRLNK